MVREREELTQEYFDNLPSILDFDSGFVPVETKEYNVVTKDFGSHVQTKIYKNPVGASRERPEGFVIDRKSWAEKRKNLSSVEDLQEVLNRQERSVKSSASRSKQTIIDMARANDWLYFVTLTFDKQKVDRFDYDAVCKKLKNWIDYQRKLYPGIKYIFVPERHENGAWHFHGIISDFSEPLICYSGRNCIGKRSFESTEDSGKGKPIYNFTKYKLGWNTLTKIEDSQKVSFYIVKYLTKEVVNSTVGKRRFWNSLNLEKPIIDKMLLDEMDKKNLQKCLKTSADFTKKIEIDHPAYQNEMDIYESSVS